MARATELVACREDRIPVVPGAGGGAISLHNGLSTGGTGRALACIRTHPAQLQATLFRTSSKAWVSWMLTVECLIIRPKAPGPLKQRLAGAVMKLAFASLGAGPLVTAKQCMKTASRASPLSGPGSDLKIRSFMSMVAILHRNFLKIVRWHFCQPCAQPFWQCSPPHHRGADVGNNCLPRAAPNCFA